MGSDTWASTIYCVSIKKLKKLVRQCELRRSLHVSVFTIESVLYLIHLQNSCFMFALHQFLDSCGFSRGFAHSLLHCMSPISQTSKSETPSLVVRVLRKTRG